MTGEVVVPRRELDSAEVWDGVVAAARQRLDAVINRSRPAPYRALDLVAAARTASREEAFAAEDEALADLIMSDEMRASVYAFGLVSGGKKPVGAPDRSLAQPVTRVGIVGAGLMAAQIAMLFAQRLGVPVVMRDLDQERVDKGLAAVRSSVDRLTSTGRMSESAASRLIGSIHGTTDLAEFASCDLVIEAVTEILDLKKKVFAELETVISPTTILATNTSALSVTAMAADLQHPERVVGLHFFNPVAAMPLVEVVQAERDVARGAGHRVRRRGQAAQDGRARRRPAGLRRQPAARPAARRDRRRRREGHAGRGRRPRAAAARPADAAVRAVRPGRTGRRPARADVAARGAGRPVPALPRPREARRRRARPWSCPRQAKGLPKPVDPAIQAAFTRDGGRPPLDEAGVLDSVLTALTVEVGHMLEEGVVATPQQIDLCMILGAGWGFHLGGLTPYLDRTGYSERVLGRRILPDGVANVPAV